MCHTRTIVRDTSICLLGPSLITCRDENMRPRYHAQPTKLFRSIEDGRWESRRHLRVQSNLNTSLDLGLAFDDGVKQVDCGNSSFTVVCEERDKSGIPLVGNLGERSRAR